MRKSGLESYLSRFNGNPPLMNHAVAPDLRGVIVIPCFLEPDWKATLDSLLNGDSSSGSFEILVVINASSSASEKVKAEQIQTMKSIRNYADECSETHLRFHVINAMELPPKHAGVGLARKIGMDEALHRLHQAGNLTKGFIVGLDADCICEANYLKALESHFSVHPKTPGCSLHFEHPLSGNLPAEIYATAGKYELHLRYYIEALRYARFPYAYHTIGSSMAVRAPTYMAQGGMNRRKAGEDFYFLHKIIPQGGFTELTTTTVHPSPRTSERVPFGTGRAVIKHLKSTSFPTYPWEAIEDLRAFFDLAHKDAQTNGTNASMVSSLSTPVMIQDFLDHINGWDEWKVCGQSTSNGSTYLKRFFQWFDSFMCMKFIHYARDNKYGEPDVVAATGHLFKKTGLKPTMQIEDEVQAHLQSLRTRQKAGWSLIDSHQGFL